MVERGGSRIELDEAEIRITAGPDRGATMTLGTDSVRFSRSNADNAVLGIPFFSELDDENSGLLISFPDLLEGRVDANCRKSGDHVLVRKVNDLKTVRTKLSQRSCCENTGENNAQKRMRLAVRLCQRNDRSLNLLRFVA